jgi:hypothetical protein
MPAKKNPLSAEEQRKRFEVEVARLVAAGELTVTEADEALDRLVKKAAENR